MVNESTLERREGWLEICVTKDGCQSSRLHGVPKKRFSFKPFPSETKKTSTGTDSECVTNTLAKEPSAFGRRINLAEL